MPTAHLIEENDGKKTLSLSLIHLYKDGLDKPDQRIQKTKAKEKIEIKTDKTHEPKDKQNQTYFIRKHAIRKKEKEKTKQNLELTKSYTV
jgi:hypothetical protein